MRTWREYFPFKPYDQQIELISLIQEAISSGKSLVVEAPTGIGKTVSVLSSFLPFREEYKLIWTCRTHSQVERVLEELYRIKEFSGEELSGIGVLNRRDMCVNPSVREISKSPREAVVVCKEFRKIGRCPFHRKISKSEINEILEIGILPPSLLLRKCEEMVICPHEVFVSLASEADVVVCNYHHFFNPEIAPSFQSKLGISMGEVVLVVDEAHNLEKFSSEVQSKEITENTLNRASKEAKEFEAEEEFKEAKEFLEDLVEKNLKRGAEVLIPWEYVETSEEIDELGEELIFIGEEVWAERISLGKRPVSYLHSIGVFLLKLSSVKGSREYALFISKENGLKFEVVCLDPSLIGGVLEEVRCSVSMSGTIDPNAYSRVMGLDSPMKGKFECPFPQENKLTLIVRGVSSLKRMRTERTYEKMVTGIETCCKYTPGNVLVFCPSYEVLDGVLSLLSDKINGKKVYFESKEKDSQEIKREMKEFKERSTRGGAVWIGVMRGRYSEGEDFPGLEANSVLLLGIPYPERNPRVEAQIRYYEEKFPGIWRRERRGGYYKRISLGEYYAYWLPAYYALNQAAGRVHRSKSDKGAVIFMDYRVKQPKVWENLNPWIKKGAKIVSIEEMPFYLRRFWIGE